MRKPKRWYLIGVALVLVQLTACGVALTPLEQQVYAAYLADDNPPVIEDKEPYSTGWAFGLSALFPPLGHWYNGNIFAGLMWGTFGVWLWPFMVPAISASADAEKLNIKHVVKQYRILRHAERD